MADESAFGGGTALFGFGGGLEMTPSQDDFVSPEAESSRSEDDRIPEHAQPTQGFGLDLSRNPGYTKPTPQKQPTADEMVDAGLNQAQNLLQQRIQRAGAVATDWKAQLFAPEQALKAREFLPKAAEELQKIQGQQAQIQANRVQAQRLGLAPGEGGLTDQSDQAARISVAQDKILKNSSVKDFQALKSVDAKAAEAIQDQFFSNIGTHIDTATNAFSKLSNMQTPREYDEAVKELRATGKLGELEAVGLKVPNYDEFQKQKGAYGATLRQAQQSAQETRNKLEARNSYQPMEEKEAKTYSNRIRTAFGDQIGAGTWSRNGATNTPGVVVAGMNDPRNLGPKEMGGTGATLASEEQRKALAEDVKNAVPKEDMEKFRSANRTYSIATTDQNGKPLPAGRINTNPNVQQGIAEGLASALRGGSGGANVGLLKIELAKRGWAQGAIDGLISNYAGAVNTLFKGANQKDDPYLSERTQRQIRDVVDALHAYDVEHVSGALANSARRAGALGLGASDLGLTPQDGAALNNLFVEGRNAQVDAMMKGGHQAISAGDGVLQVQAQTPMSGAQNLAPGQPNATTLPGSQPLQTPAQQATNPRAAEPGRPAAPVAPAAQPPAQPAPNTAAVGAPAAQPVSIAGRDVNVALPQGASQDYVSKMQRIESGNERDPWKAGAGGLSSASGAFQFINSTWQANKPAGAPNRAADATPQQQAEALATLTSKNAASLQRAGVDVNDTNLYIAHNLGAGGAEKLLHADPNADARSIVGEAAARNNPMFFKGRPTVEQVMDRYTKAVNPAEGEVKQRSTAGGAPKGVGDKIAEFLGNTPRGAGEILPDVLEGKGEYRGDKIATAKERAESPVTEYAPAIGATVGGMSGGVAGGAVGGGAGQAFKDWMQGREQNPAEIAKQAALGGVGGAFGGGLGGAAARAAGTGAIEGGAALAEGKDLGEAAGEAAVGAASSAGGEAFGRMLGMVGHKIVSNFRPEAVANLQKAADSVLDARAAAEDAAKALEQSAPKLAGGVDNPAYAAAEQAAKAADKKVADAERGLTAVLPPGVKADEAVYAAEQVKGKTPTAEARAAKPVAAEKADIGAGYEAERQGISEKGVGAPKATGALPDGPVAKAQELGSTGYVAKAAQSAEVAITAPAKTWREKWDQLAAERSKLLDLERDALTSTSAGRTQQAQELRAIADTIREKQRQVATHVYGSKEAGDAAVKRMQMLDTRYRRLMDAVPDGDIAKVAALTGKEGREAAQKFEAFAAGDPEAIRAFRAMQQKSKESHGEGWLHAAIHLPVIGKAISGARMLLLMNRWSAARRAGADVKFGDLVKAEPNTGVERGLQRMGGTAARQ